MPVETEKSTDFQVYWIPIIWDKSGPFALLTGLEDCLADLVTLTHRALIHMPAHTRRPPHLDRFPHHDEWTLTVH